MHRAILRQLQCARGAPLAKLRSGRLTIIGAFEKSRAVPLWIAKTASDPTEAFELDKERSALLYLEPWAGPLGIPRVLAYEEDSGSTCLIVTGVPGVNKRAGMTLTKSPDRLGRYLDQAMSWLATFHSLVPPRQKVSVEDLIAGLRATLRSGRKTTDQYERLLALIEQLAPADNNCLVSAHGDFFHLNVLFGSDRLYVIDWPGFGVNFSLDDFLTFASTFAYYSGGRACDVNEIHRAIFFSDLKICDCMSNCLLAQEPDPERIRFFYYANIASQIAAGNASSDNRGWGKLLEALEAAKYPGPCSNSRIS